MSEPTASISRMPSTHELMVRVIDDQRARGGSKVLGLPREALIDMGMMLIDPTIKPKDALQWV